MSELTLTRDERLTLRADAHHVAFSVLLGNAGLTPAVVKEVDRALETHGLIKVKVPSDDREERAEIYKTLAEELGAARIQSIGKTLVLYRPIPEKTEEKAPKSPSKTKRPAPKKAVVKSAKVKRAGSVHRTTKKKALSR